MRTRPLEQHYVAKGHWLIAGYDVRQRVTENGAHRGWTIYLGGKFQAARDTLTLVREWISENAEGEGDGSGGSH